jgi:hypothetical protein
LPTSDVQLCSLASHSISAVKTRHYE